MTRPQEALAEPVSNRTSGLTAPRTPDDLICPGQVIFDIHRVRAALDSACGKADGAKDIRAAAVAILQDANTQGRTTIAEAFAASPHS